MIDDNKYYFCRLCGKRFRWFQDNPGVRIVCAVMHGPDECCHYMEEEVPDANVSKIQTDVGEI